VRSVKKSFRHKCVNQNKINGISVEPSVDLSYRVLIEWRFIHKNHVNYFQRNIRRDFFLHIVIHFLRVFINLWMERKSWYKSAKSDIIWRKNLHLINCHSFHDTDCCEYQLCDNLFTALSSSTIISLPHFYRLIFCCLIAFNSYKWYKFTQLIFSLSHIAWHSYCFHRIRWASIQFEIKAADRMKICHWYKW
jgi:hypothetical protein